MSIRSWNRNTVNLSHSIATKILTWSNEKSWATTDKTYVPGETSGLRPSSVLGYGSIDRLTSRNCHSELRFQRKFHCPGSPLPDRVGRILWMTYTVKEAFTTKGRSNLDKCHSNGSYHRHSPPKQTKVRIRRPKYSSAWNCAG